MTTIETTSATGIDRIVDAHHHLWDLHANYYPWLTDQIEPRICGDYSAIRKDYLLSNYFADCAGMPVVKSVHVQAEQDHARPVDETRWLQSLADIPESDGFPHAIIGYADFANPRVEATLEAHAHHPNFRGIRQTLHHHPELLCDPLWCRSIKLLSKYDLTFDLQVFPSQLSDALRVVDKNPNTRFILCHAGLPADHSEQGRTAWRRAIYAFSERENVVCKISGLGMFFPGWPIDAVSPIVNEILSAFGADRCMCGSNFPVDKLTTDFGTIWHCLLHIAAGLSADERSALLAGTAEHIYRI